MLFKILLATTFLAGFCFGLAKNAKNRNEEPCNWFIDLIQRRRLNREANQVPMLLEDITEEPKEYEKYNYSAPFDFAGDHLSENDPQMIGCGLTATTTSKPAGNNEPCGMTTPKATPVSNSNQPCALPSTAGATTSTSTPTTTSTTTEEPCEEEKRAVQEKNDSLFEKRKKAMVRQRLAQRLSLLEAGRKSQRKYYKKTPRRKRRIKRSYRPRRKNFKKCKTTDCENPGGDCIKTTESPATERILLEANIHVGEGFQELLLDMLSPGDKTIKIAEEEENDKLPQMRWEILQDKKRK